MQSVLIRRPKKHIAIQLISSFTGVFYLKVILSTIHQVTTVIEMPNAIEKLVASSGDPQPPKSGGRPMHSQWFGFKKVYVKGKITAKCSGCTKTITNTARARLEKHR